MKENKLYSILDLLEEINKVDRMIDLHNDSESKVMYSQYSNQKMKLSVFLFKELITISDHEAEVMYLIRVFLEKFYDKEIKTANFSEDSYLNKIREVVTN